MCGIAGQQHSSEPVGVGNKEVRRPWICDKDVMVKSGADEIANYLARINCFRCFARRKSTVQRPGVESFWAINVPRAD